MLCAQVWGEQSAPTQHPVATRGDLAGLVRTSPALGVVGVEHGEMRLQ